MFCYLLALKIRYPQRIFLLRGNEEDKFETQTRSFYNYCLGYYQEDESAWKLYCSVFECLPLAACVDNKVGPTIHAAISFFETKYLLNRLPQIFCVHGGLSPIADCLQLIQIIDRYNDHHHHHHPQQQTTTNNNVPLAS